LASYYEEHKSDLLQRLRKIEGQVRGVQSMIEQDRYCVEVLTQLAAVRAALNRVSMGIIESHTRGCVADAVRDDKSEEKIAELVEVLLRYLK